MASGQVQAARTELVRTEASADVAWALARSYSPNFLSTILTADAAADVGAGRALRWYRTWHTLAVKDGLVADSVPVDELFAGISKPGRILRLAHVEYLEHLVAVVVDGLHGNSFAGRLERERHGRMQRLQVLVVEVAGYGSVWSSNGAQWHLAVNMRHQEH